MLIVHLEFNHRCFFHTLQTMAEQINFPRSTRMPDLANPMIRVAALHFNEGQRTFALDANCVGVEVPLEQPRLSRSDQHPVAIYHAGHLLQVWATTPRSGAIRVLFVDYHILARKRQIIGYLTIGHVPGDIRISDYRHPISIGVIPNTLRTDSVYILGIRFDNQDTNGVQNAIPANVIAYDHAEKTEFVEQLEFNRFGYEDIFIRCSSAISVRALVRGQNNQRIDRFRYPSENTNPTVIRPLVNDLVQPRNPLAQPLRFHTPVPRMLDTNRSRSILKSPSALDTTAQSNASTSTGKRSTDLPSANSTPALGSVVNPASGALSRSVRPRSVHFEDQNATQLGAGETKPNASTSSIKKPEKTDEEILAEMLHCSICDISVGSTEDKKLAHTRNRHIGPRTDSLDEIEAISGSNHLFLASS